jgi:hypothetical protein
MKVRGVATCVTRMGDGVARNVVDLPGREAVGPEHVVEAV